MKILFVCHRFPYPPNEGGKIRSFNMIAHLHQNHDVTVASLTESRAEREAVDGMRPFCSQYIVEHIFKPLAWLKAILNLFSTVPSSMGYFHSRKLRRRIQRLLKEKPFDLIVVHCSSVAPFVLPSGDIPKILDFCDMDSQKWLIYARHKPFPLSLVYWLEGIKLQRAEKRLAAEFNGSSVATAAELETLKEFNVGKPGFSFPNGVDIEYFAPSDAPYDEKTICFMGKMNYYPNEKCMLDFCATVFPLLREKYPELKLSIIGSNPTKKILALQSIAGVEVTGRVDDVRPYVQRSALSVIPLTIARGTQNKILESMAMGIPVVCSKIAARGIDAIPGEHVLVASSPEEFVACISRLLDQKEERERFAKAARARMLSHHTWDHAMQEMDKNIIRCIRKQPEAQNFELRDSSVKTTKLS